MPQKREMAFIYYSSLGVKASFELKISEVKLKLSYSKTTCTKTCTEIFYYTEKQVYLQNKLYNNYGSTIS